MPYMQLRQNVADVISNKEVDELLLMLLKSVVSVYVE